MPVDGREIAEEAFVPEDTGLKTAIDALPENLSWMLPYA